MDKPFNGLALSRVVRAVSDVTEAADTASLDALRESLVSWAAVVERNNARVESTVLGGDWPSIARALREGPPETRADNLANARRWAESFEDVIVVSENGIAFLDNMARFFDPAIHAAVMALDLTRLELRGTLVRQAQIMDEALDIALTVVARLDPENDAPATPWEQVEAEHARES